MRAYNAAGPKSKELADIRRLLASPVPKVTIGSVTPFKGNTGVTFWKDGGTTLNRVGLKSRGIAYYEKVLPSIIASTKKTIRVSIAGKTPAEYGEFARRLIAIGVQEIEVCASCPNIWENGTQKSIATYDLALLDAIIKEIGIVSRERIFDYKFSPIPDPVHLRHVAERMAKTPHVRAVVACNTFPNAFAGRVGLAGLGGTALHHIALGQVHQFRQLLPRSIIVVGVGGVRSKKEVQNFTRAGADEVQIGSHYFEHGTRVFEF